MTLNHTVRSAGEGTGSLRCFKRKFLSGSCRWPKGNPLHLTVFWTRMTLGAPAIADTVFQVMLKERLFFLRSCQASGEVLHVDTNPLPKIIILSLNSPCIFGG